MKGVCCFLTVRIYQHLNPYTKTEALKYSPIVHPIFVFCVNDKENDW